MLPVARSAPENRGTVTLAKIADLEAASKSANKTLACRETFSRLKPFASIHGCGNKPDDVNTITFIKPLNISY
jgi:hypothetical protein